MCGRYTACTPSRVLAKILGTPLPELRPRFNIAPGQDVAVVRMSPARQLSFDRLLWGLVPQWAGEGAQAQINARCETAARKPWFRAAFRDRRCLVLADGFYEWKKLGARKQPYYIRLRDESPFAFAGLWEPACGNSAARVGTCCILTTAPNELTGPIHDRMPVILAWKDHEKWLGNGFDDPAALSEVLRPYPSTEMVAYPVSTCVNRLENDSPRCIEPVEERAEAPSEPMLFN